MWYYVYFRITQSSPVRYYGSTQDKEKAQIWAGLCGGWVTTKEDNTCIDR